MRQITTKRTLLYSALLLVTIFFCACVAPQGISESTFRKHVEDFGYLSDRTEDMEQQIDVKGSKFDSMAYYYDADTEKSFFYISMASEKDADEYYKKITSKDKGTYAEKTSVAYNHWLWNAAESCAEVYKIKKIIISGTAKAEDLKSLREEMNAIVFGDPAVKEEENKEPLEVEKPEEEKITFDVDGVTMKTEDAKKADPLQGLKTATFYINNKKVVFDNTLLSNMKESVGVSAVSYALEDFSVAYSDSSISDDDENGIALWKSLTENALLATEENETTYEEREIYGHKCYIFTTKMPPIEPEKEIDYESLREMDEENSETNDETGSKTDEGAEEELPAENVLTDTDTEEEVKRPVAISVLENVGFGTLLRIEIACYEEDIDGALQAFLVNRLQVSEE